jgi:hypothetical protein
MRILYIETKYIEINRSIVIVLQNPLINIDMDHFCSLAAETGVFVLSYSVNRRRYSKVQFMIFGVKYFFMMFTDKFSKKVFVIYF